MATKASAAPAAELVVGDRIVRISHPDRVYFPARGETKLDLALYYLSVGDGIVRGLAERPTMLHRFPEGVGGEKVHQKRLPGGAPAWVQTVRVCFPRYNRFADELCVTELAAVIWAVQMSTVEFHPWNCRRADTERPDEWRIDLDPMPQCGFERVRSVAHLAREVGHAANPLEAALRHRVQVDAPLDGTVGVGAPAVPRVELDRGHLHRPDHGGQLGDTQLVREPVVSREAHPDGLDPGRGAAREPLLVHLLAADSFGEPVQHGGPLCQPANDPVTDAEVVEGQVELRLPPRREVDPVRMGDAHDPVPDDQLGGWGRACLGSHGNQPNDVLPFGPKIRCLVSG